MTMQMPLPKVVYYVVTAWWQMNQLCILSIFVPTFSNSVRALLFLLRTIYLSLFFRGILSYPRLFCLLIKLLELSLKLNH